MLLQRLAEYSASMNGAVPPFHREQVFTWQLDLDRFGNPRDRFLGSLERPDEKGKVRGTTFATPASVRTVGVAANLAADDVQYVLGWADPTAKPDRVAQCHAAFHDLSQRWADSERGKTDPVAQAVAAFYRQGNAALVERPEGFTSKQRVLIAVDGVPAYRAPSVADFWAGEVASRKGGGTEGICLVCGRVGPLLDTVPGKVPARLVPGASNDASLVSINERVFGYDLSMQLACTPLCLVCGEGVASGLAGVLERNAVSYGGQDSRLAWWLTGAPEFNVMTMLDHPTPEDVHALFDGVRAGTPSPAGEGDLDPHSPAGRFGTFCSLSVGGNVARVMVRDWVEMPLADLETNITAWMEDLEVASRRSDGARHQGLFALLLATGRWVRDRRRYADIGAKGADRPVDAQRDLLRAAIRRVPIPPSLLAHVVHRVSSDGRMDDARAALFRLCLTRHPLVLEKPMPDLEPAKTDPAYVAGRLFAELEQIQYDASGGKPLNTTYGDRYFAGAIANPRASVVNGRRDANAWLKRLRRDRRGSAIHHERVLDELFALIEAGEGLPARTTMRQQASFLLGYHHHRAEHFRSLPTKKSTASTVEPDIIQSVAIVEENAR